MSIQDPALKPLTRGSMSRKWYKTKHLSLLLFFFCCVLNIFGNPLCMAMWFDAWLNQFVDMMPKVEQVIYRIMPVHWHSLTLQPPIMTKQLFSLKGKTV